ncbi:hypothetical protein BH18GEM1_BH18GEM1_05530 [soil metagenome]
MSETQAALLVALGVVSFLDQWPAVQTMISRPVVVGMLVGLVLDAPMEGAVWGAVFEAVYLGVLPVGAARYPDAGLAALVGTTVALAGRTDGIAPAGYAVLAAAVAGFLGERVGWAHRRWNDRTAVRVRERVMSGEPSAPGRGVAAALARAAVLGAVVAAVAIAAALAGLGALGGTIWSGPLPLEDVRVLAAAAALAAGIHLFGDRGGSRAAMMVGGAAGGALLVWAAGTP